MSSALQSPARYYMTRYRSKAEEFCRALAARGLVRQAEWKPQTHIAANTFRTYIRPATATQEKRFIVAYQDWTPGSGVAKPPRLDDRTKRAPRRLCVNGCPRKNEDRAGECHACRSRRMYREDSTYREAKRARSRSWKARRNERMRVDPEYRARINSRRRELEARRREGI